MNMQVSRVLGSPQWQLCQESCSQGHRPGRAQQRRPGLGRPGAQWSTPKTTCVYEADRTDRRPPVAM